MSTECSRIHLMLSIVDFKPPYLNCEPQVLIMDSTCMIVEKSTTIKL